MAFGLPTDTRGQVLLLIVVVSLAGGYLLWDKVQVPQRNRLTQTGRDIDSLTEIVRKAKADLASGSVESMRRQVETYRATLGLMRRLIPEQNEVTTLLDDISNRAKLRGIMMGKFQPLSVEAGPALAITSREPADTAKKKAPPQPAFDVYRYRLEVYGHYDQVGEFLSDVASLPRIMVPQNIHLVPATQQTQHLLADTVGGLLEADFDLRTYVKRVPPVGAGGAGNARP